MKFKYLLFSVASIILISSCSNNNNIIRGPSDPNDNSEEIENPHLVRGIPLNKLVEAVEAASSTICDITSYKSSTSESIQNFDFSTHTVTDEEFYGIDGTGTLYTNSVLHESYTTNNDDSFSKLLEYPSNNSYFYINDLFTEIRLRYFDVSDNLTKDIKYLDYSPLNYQQTFYPAHLFELSQVDLSTIEVAGYLSDDRILLQVAKSDTISETIGEENYEVSVTTFENYLLKDDKIDEYQKTSKTIYTLSSDESVSFTKLSILNSETYAYEDNGEFNKEGLPSVSEL